MKGNDFVAFLLRTPLHVFMPATMLITVIGRRTGNPILVPVNYYRKDDTLWVISGRKRTWWRNIKPNSQLQLRIGGKDITGIANVVYDEKMVADRITDYVRYLPISARSLGIKVDNGTANREDINRLAKQRLFIQIRMDQRVT